MLKLPRGWAAAPAAPTRTASPTAVESARALTGPGSRSPPGRAEPLERPGGGLRVQDMEIRVQRQRPGDVPSRAVGIAARLVDESRMEVQPRVGRAEPQRDRKSTRLNSSHVAISYAVFCLKKKNHIRTMNCSVHV